MKNNFLNRFFNIKRVRIIISLALFNFIFLGTEYLFDNMMALVTDSKQVVIAQSYILGVSVIGFLLYAVIDHFINMSTNIKYIGCFAMVVISIICIFIIQHHSSYEVILISGCIVFILLGIAGSAIHFMAARELKGDNHLAKTVGVAYALGLFLQFINNNLVNDDLVESIIISVFLAIFIVITANVNLSDGTSDGRSNILSEENEFVRNDKFSGNNIETIDNIQKASNPILAGVMLIAVVILMTCIFSTLDNVVTLFHSEGYMDIGQWPRLLLALSGLMAGVLFDIKNHRYMNIIMYCVTLLSTICVLVIVSGGSFLVGLIVFYLSAGFFVVFFTTSFMDLSYKMKVPQVWAGLGRAVNNICAGLTGAFSLELIQSADSVVISIIALTLFALISVAIFTYTNQLRGDVDTEAGIGKEEYEDSTGGMKNEDDAEHFRQFSETFKLTAREQEVLKLLLTSDDSVQNMAEQLFISRAALYRHISSLNEKTNTKSRIGLLQFYYAWADNK